MEDVLLIKKGRVVSMHYTLKDSSGKELESTFNEEPFEFLYGRGRVVPGLEDALLGLQPGDRKSVIVPPSEGYGGKEKDLVLKLHRNELPENDIIVGKEFRKVYSDGRSEVFRVSGFVDDWVYLDKNHPFAGKELHYEVEILDVRVNPGA
jgi:FKBP-type peptidyl-prolyl cis-trans isomerase 2